jgi:hypothetical protein
MFGKKWNTINVETETSSKKIVQNKKNFKFKKCWNSKNVQIQEFSISSKKKV